MSYSFSVRAATKSAALEKLAAEFAKVAEAQPVHKADVEQAKAAAEAFVGVLAVDETHDVCVNVSGSLSTSSDAVVGASLSIYAFNGVKAPG